MNKENPKEVNSKPNGGRWNRNSAAALTAQDFKVTCTYYRKSHPSVKCDVVTDIQARNGILKKEGRRFVCLRKSHLARYCQTKSCFKYHNRHHPSICESEITRQPTLPDKNPNNKSIFKPQVKNENDSTVTLATEVKTSVLLQTAKVTVSITDDQTKSIQARILFGIVAKDRMFQIVSKKH